MNAEIKRRTNVVGIFPNDPSIVRLVGAMMLEQNDAWALHRRNMQLEGLQTLSDTARTRLSAVARGVPCISSLVRAADIRHGLGHDRLAKNTAQLHTLFALSNLWMVRRDLMGAQA